MAAARWENEEERVVVGRDLSPDEFKQALAARDWRYGGFRSLGAGVVHMAEADTALVDPGEASNAVSPEINDF